MQHHCPLLHLKTVVATSIINMSSSSSSPSSSSFTFQPSTIKLTKQDKINFYNDGFLIIKNCIDKTLTTNARRAINMNLFNPGQHLKFNSAVTGNGSPLLGNDGGGNGAWQKDLNTSPILLNLYEQCNPIVEQLTGNKTIGGRKFAQIALRFPAEPHDNKPDNDWNIPDVQIPHNAWTPHLDGLYNGGSNGVKLGVVNTFTCLVGISLSDQASGLNGNLGVLKGSHKINELCFQEQLKLGGPLGPGGPNWPLKDNVSNGFIHYPPSLQKYYPKHEAKASFNRQFDLNPKPTLVRLNEGDIVIAHFSTLHAATRNLSSDVRYQLYFRPVCENAVKRRRTKNKDIMSKNLIDIWCDWDGMKEIVVDNYKEEEERRGNDGDVSSSKL